MIAVVNVHCLKQILYVKKLLQKSYRVCPFKKHQVRKKLRQVQICIISISLLSYIFSFLIYLLVSVSVHLYLYLCLCLCLCLCSSLSLSVRHLSANVERILCSSSSRQVQDCYIVSEMATAVALEFGLGFFFKVESSQSEPGRPPLITTAFMKWSGWHTTQYDAQAIGIKSKQRNQPCSSSPRLLATLQGSRALHF